MESTLLHAGRRPLLEDRARSRPIGQAVCVTFEQPSWICNRISMKSAWGHNEVMTSDMSYHPGRMSWTERRSSRLVAICGEERFSKIGGHWLGDRLDLWWRWRLRPENIGGERSIPNFQHDTFNYLKLRDLDILAPQHLEMRHALRNADVRSIRQSLQHNQTHCPSQTHREQELTCAIMLDPWDYSQSE